MGVFASYFEAVLFLALCLIVSVCTFISIYSDKWPRWRKGLIILYYVIFTELVFVWFNLFFSDLFPLVGSEKRFMVYALISLLCWAMLAFFSFIILKAKKEKNDIICSMSVLMSFIALFSVFNFTFQYNVVKEQERAEKMYEKNTPNKFTSELNQCNDQNESLTTALVIPGGSLCYTLGVTKEEALNLAKLNNLKYYYKGKKLIVIVSPGDEFIKVSDVWILKSILIK
jgi:hypothetical protein